MALRSSRWSRLVTAVLAGLVIGAAPSGLGQSRLAVAADQIELSIDAAKVGPTIDRNIFGPFAEHLGHGIYEGVWARRRRPCCRSRSRQWCGAIGSPSRSNRSP